MDGAKREEGMRARHHLAWTATAAGALALLLAGASSALAGKLDDILSRGKLIVGTGSTNPPWHFVDENGKTVGFDADIGHIIAKGLFDDPEKIEFVTQASDARIPNIVTDKVDITCQFMTVTAQRAQQVNFTIPYYREGVGLLLLKDGSKKSYEELKAAGSGATISVLQNVYAEDLVHQALPEAKVDQYESVDLMYQALNSGRADAAATDQSSLRWFMVQNPDRYLDGGYAWSPQTYACAVKKGDQDFLNFVNTALHEAMTGTEFATYKASFQKWFGVSPPEPQIGFPTELR
jgi:polar amino acid transport system substrate-binding protein